MRAIGKLADQRLKQAKKLGLNYGPKQYFDDQYVIRTKIRKSKVMNLVAQRQIGEMQQMMQANCKPSENLPWQDRQKLARDKRKFWTSQISVEAEAYRYRTEFPDEDRAEAKRDLQRWGWRGILGWLLKLYLRVMFLMLPLLLMRMINDRGILETILADKRKFVLALLLWPYFFSKYPNNVVREIIVEAELRRIGKLFRRFTSSEKEDVRRIANSSKYGQWLRQQRRQPAFCFERCLLIAVLGTLICSLLPTRAKASTTVDQHSGQVQIVQVARDGPTLTVGDHSDDCNTSTGVVAALPEAFQMPELAVVSLVIEDKPPLKRRISSAIDHVPLFARLAELFETSGKRRNHENRNPDGSTGSNPAVDRLRECLGYQ